jgi:hypothetical protein
MDKILARRFAPFNFSVVPGFPNVVPIVDQWVDFLPIFREHRDDNPAEHLREFHELMHQWEIHHEDVLMKMFMFSLDGDAREWYRSLPPASISSLREFHAAFNTQCQKFYSSELIHHSCCEEYRDGVQDIVRSCESCENERYTSEELMELVKYFSARIEGLEADFACRSYEENVEDIPVLEMDVLGSPAYDEEVMSDTDQEEEQSFSMIPVYSDCETDPGESQEGEKEEPHLSSILAQSFSPFNFSAISGYPHLVPAINEWDDYLPRFRGSKHDEPGKHLFNFHVCMLEHDFVHEDVLIKMFKFSLEGDAREWCQSLPAASIHSLKDFHDAFTSYYEKIYLSHLVLDDCCKKFAFYIQHVIESFSCDESGKDLIERESEDKNKRVPHSPAPEEYSEAKSISSQPSYESESSYQEQHDREEEPSMDIHEETPCSQLADVIRADRGEMEELKVQIISCPEPVNEQISPGINCPASVLYPPVHSENIE